MLDYDPTGAGAAAAAADSSAEALTDGSATTTTSTESDAIASDPLVLINICLLCRRRRRPGRPVACQRLRRIAEQRSSFAGLVDGQDRVGVGHGFTRLLQEGCGLFVVRHRWCWLYFPLAV
jgi:hypothetical protein